VVHVKDLFAALRRGELERHVFELQLPVVFLPESLPQDEALEQLRASQGHLAVVVEDRGGTAGIITAEDLIEELFGEIRDEFDSEELALAEVQEQGWRVSGQISLFELEEVLGRELARTPDAETLAGLLFDLLHRVPEEGDCIDHDGFRFVVETVQQHTVSFCIIVPLEVPEGGGSAS
jgi:CBS domain containing-hemolysin-like protein